jgi:hypothetical protein
MPAAELQATTPATSAAEPAKSARIPIAHPLRSVCRVFVYRACRRRSAGGIKGQLYQRISLRWATMTTRASVSHVNLPIRGGYVLTIGSDRDIHGGRAHVRASAKA